MQTLLSEIWVARDDRQRRELDVSDLLESIPRCGVLVPIIIAPQQGPDGQPYKLIAGERRFTAAKQLALESIPSRLMSDLSEHELAIIELEENLRRKDLSWQDQVAAFAKIHKMLIAQAQAKNENWSVERTAEFIGIHKSWLHRVLNVAAQLHRPEVAALEGLSRAMNFVDREQERRASDAVSDIISASTDAIGEMLANTIGESGSTPSDATLPADGAPLQSLREQARIEIAKAAAARPTILPADESILHASFLEWAPQYSGPPFNFIHCDFPYGVNAFGGQWSGRDAVHNYEDTPDIYIALIKSLCANLDRVMAHSAHLMFWLSSDVLLQAETLALFAKLAPTLRFTTVPLVWFKSDNVGIMPDPKREARRVTETALVASREDRLLVKSVANCIAAQTNKEHHPHTKPESVLKHFFSMFVDGNTRMLDPTCGGGSALRAAEHLGASHVLGLELADEYVHSARSALKSFRVLKAANELGRARRGT